MLKVSVVANNHRTRAYNTCTQYSPFLCLEGLKVSHPGRHLTCNSRLSGFQNTCFWTLENWKFWQCYCHTVVNINDDYFWEVILYSKYFLLGSACSSHGCHNLWMNEPCHILFYNEKQLILSVQLIARSHAHALLRTQFFFAYFLCKVCLVHSWTAVYVSCPQPGSESASAMGQDRAA